MAMWCSFADTKASRRLLITIRSACKASGRPSILWARDERGPVRNYCLHFGPTSRLQTEHLCQAAGHNRVQVESLERDSNLLACLHIRLEHDHVGAGHHCLHAEYTPIIPTIHTKSISICHIASRPGPNAPWGGREAQPRHKIGAATPRCPHGPAKCFGASSVASWRPSKHPADTQNSPLPSALSA